MVRAVLFFIALGMWTVAGCGFIVIGIRKKGWSQRARTLTIIAGAIVLLPALYELLVMVLVAYCNPRMSCP